MKEDTELVNKNVKIAIVGVGTLYPGSPTAQQFWKNILTGKDLISEVPSSYWSIKDYYDKNPKAKDKVYCRRGGFVPQVEFDPLEWGIPPQNLQAIDTAQLLVLIVAKSLLNDTFHGNYKGTDFSKTSVILGVSGTQELVIQMANRLSRPIWISCLREFGIDDNKIEKICDRICSHFPEWQENTFPGMLQNVIAGRVANRFDLGGTNCTIDAACASSLASIHQGINELLLHQSDMTIVGGVDSNTDPFAFMCFSKTPAISPTEDCRPFSINSDGTIVAQGLGLFALKRLEDAIKDGNHIYAVIRGIGTSSDGRSKSIYAPIAEGQISAYKRAYDMAGYSARSVELLEAHGTGTKAGDVEEFKSSKMVFESADKNDKQWCAFGSVKSQIGHTKAAAGAAGLFKVTMGLHHKILPPTIKIEKPNPQLEINYSPFYLNVSARPWVKNPDEIRRGSVSAFGFGGTDYHMTIEEYKGPGKKPCRIYTQDEYLLLLSAENNEQLLTYCNKIIKDSINYDNDYIPYITHSSYKTFNCGHSLRLAIVVTNQNDLLSKLNKIIKHIKDQPQKSLNEQDLYYSCRSKSGKLAFVFSGQGSQYLNMGSDIAMSFDAARSIWDATTQIPIDSFQQLHEIVFPKPVFSDDEKGQQQDRLNNTMWTQPALAAVEFSQLELLNALGVKADYAAGHSFGELVALAYAGLCDFPTLLKIARKRGEFMAESCDEAGSMLAVIQPIAETVNVVKEAQLELTAANINSPTELILSGSVHEIQKAKDICNRNKIYSKQLSINNAFHSKAMDNAAHKFRQLLEEIHFDNLCLPVYSNMTASMHQNDEIKIKDMISAELTNPVKFLDMIEKMYADGTRTFIEIGPGNVLTNLIKRILVDKDINIISIDNINENGLTSLLRAIAQLAVSGIEINMPNLLSEYAAPPLPDRKEIKTHKISIRGTTIKPVVPPLKVEEIMKSKDEAHLRHQRTHENIQNEQSDQQDVYHEIKQASGFERIYEHIQTSIARAHEVYQKSASDSHKAFLHMVEQTLHELHNLTPESHTLRPSNFTFSEQVAPTAKRPIKNEMMETKSANEKIEVSINETPLVTIKSKETNDTKSTILSIISAETGYPSDMLNMQMEMEADLGIDSIKRVEILSAIKEKIPDAPEFDPSQLTKIKTLQQLSDFITMKTEIDITPKAIQLNTEKPRILKEVQTNPNTLSNDIISIVAQETGYPSGMLTMQMEMEADLGIDSIKRVEILSAIKEKVPDAPEFDPSQLTKIKTLQQLSDFITRKPETEITPTVIQLNTEKPKIFDEVQTSPNALSNDIILIVAQETGYPSDMLTMQMEMEADLGIDSIKRVEILSAIKNKYPDLPEVDNLKLANIKTLQQLNDILTKPVTISEMPRQTVTNKASLDQKKNIRVIKRLIEKPLPKIALQGLTKGPAAIIKDKNAISSRLVKILKESQIDAYEIEHLTELNDKYQTVIYLGGLNDFESKNESIQCNIEAFMVAKAIAKPFLLRGGTFIIVQHTGGDFGLSADTIQAWSTGLVSLGRTLALEWEKSTIKNIDIEDISGGEEKIAKEIAHELLFGGNENEVCLAKDGKRSVLEDTMLPYSADEPLQLPENAVVLATGGAHGITAWCVEAMASCHRLNLILLGRTKLEEEPEYCKGIKSELELKKIVYENHKSANSVITPNQLENMVRTILVNRDIQQTLQFIKDKGSQAVYYSINVLDDQRLQQIIDEVTMKYGKVNALIHGAGIIRDRLIEQKSINEFESVFNIKVLGLSSLLDALKNHPLQLICLFSSLTAHDGSKGQVDYTMANQVLNGVANAEQRKRGRNCVVKSIEWGPWEGGMVTEATKNQFYEQGIGSISKIEGTDLFMKELTQKNVSVVVLSSTIKTIPTLNDKEFKEKEIYSIKDSTHSFLLSHCIKEKPVIPVCLVLEWFAHSIKNNFPESQVFIGENLKVIHGIRLNSLDPQDFIVSMTNKIIHGRSEVMMELKTKEGSLSYLMNAVVNQQDLKTNNSLIDFDENMTDWPFKIEDCYGDLNKLFHGQDFHLIESLDKYGERTATATLNGIAALKWPNLDWKTDPGIVDAVFQVASLFGQRFFNKISIPMKIKKLIIYHQGLVTDKVRCVLRFVSHDSYRAVYDINLMIQEDIIMSISGLEMIVIP